MKRALAALVLLVAGTCLAQTALTPYANQRFSYSVAYPSALLFPQGESDDGDGQVFASKTGDAKLTVFGGWRSKDLPFPCAALNDARDYPGANVSYQWRKGGVSVASGHASGGEVFYVKDIHRSDECVTLMLEYPADRSKTFKPLAARIARSLRIW